MSDVVYPNIKPVVIPDTTESYLSVRNVVSVVVVILFVVAMAWLYYKLLDKDEKIRNLEASLMARKKAPAPTYQQPDDIESQLPTSQRVAAKAVVPKEAPAAPAPSPAPAPVPASTPTPASSAHVAIVEGEDDKEIDKYL
jgi:hypothetical protein